MGRLHIDGAAEVKAAALLWSRAPAEIQKGIQREVKSWSPIFQRAVAQHAASAAGSSLVEQRIAAKVSVTSIKNGLTAYIGSAGKVGRNPARDLVRQYEFGTKDRERVSEPYFSRRRGRRVDVEDGRRTRRQLPSWDKNGRFAYPAVATTTPQLVARWVRVVAEAVTPQ